MERVRILRLKRPHPDGLNRPHEINAQNKSLDKISGCKYPLGDE
jgi:hypothetical protein